MKTRRLLNYTPDRVKENCIICGISNENEPLVSAQTIEITNTFKERAELLGDHNLLAKLAPGDMVAIEAKYHKSCDNKQRNQMRRLKRVIVQEKKFEEKEEEAD